MEKMIEKKILIVDNSKYKIEIKNIYQSAGYLVDNCETAFDAISKLKIIDYDIVVTQIMLPGDNAFELYYHITKNYPYLPIIMLTDRDMEEFFDKIINECIGNILPKPVNKNELLNLSEKLVTRSNIFGIENYISDIITHKKIRINASAKIKEAIRIISDHILSWNFKIFNTAMFNLLLNEIIINAVYHSHGLTQEKIERKPVVLKDGQYVDIHFGYNQSSIAISIIDYNGILSKTKILSSIYNVIKERKLIENAFKNGEDVLQKVSETGRGIDLVRQLANEYYFVVKKNKRTEIILIFYKKETEKNHTFSSLKIIELD